MLRPTYGFDTEFLIRNGLKALAVVAAVVGVSAFLLRRLDDWITGRDRKRKNTPNKAM
jgi:hypothetical protein